MNTVLLILVLAVLLDVAFTLRRQQANRLQHRIYPWWPGDWCHFIKAAVRKRK